nr:uncharacterized protein LOC121132112 [Lepeophtheirus salmonis]
MIYETYPLAELISIDREKIWWDIRASTGVPVVPKSLVSEFFRSFLDESHRGVKSRFRQLHSQFYWINMSSDIKTVVGTCDVYNRSKNTREIKLPFDKIRSPDKKLYHINIDLVGSFPKTNEKLMALTIIDRTTNWLEVYPLVKKIHTHPQNNGLIESEHRTPKWVETLPQILLDLRTTVKAG